MRISSQKRIPLYPTTQYTLHSLQSVQYKIQEGSSSEKRRRKLLSNRFFYCFFPRNFYLLISTGRLHTRSPQTKTTLSCIMTGSKWGGGSNYSAFLVLLYQKINILCYPSTLTNAVCSYSPAFPLTIMLLCFQNFTNKHLSINLFSLKKQL